MSKGVMKAFGLLEKRLEGAGSASMKQYRKVLKNKGNRFARQRMKIQAN